MTSSSIKYLANYQKLKTKPVEVQTSVNGN
jgi:hypothetical protein